VSVLTEILHKENKRGDAMTRSILIAEWEWTREEVLRIIKS